jgi:hypothetical protein
MNATEAALLPNPAASTGNKLKEQRNEYQNAAPMARRLHQQQQDVERWIVCASLSVNIFVTLITQ